MPAKKCNYIDANSTICGHKVMVVIMTVALLLIVSTTMVFLMNNIVTNSPLNVAAIMFGMFCVASKGLEANYEVAMFLTSSLFFTIIITIQGFNNLFYYRMLAKLPHCYQSKFTFSCIQKSIQIMLFYCQILLGGRIAVILNGTVEVVVFFFVFVFIGIGIAALSYPIFAFLVIKIVMEKRAAKAHTPRVRVKTTNARPKFFENLPALMV